MTTQVAELREQLKKLKSRLKEYQEQMKVSSADKSLLGLKIRGLKQAINSVREQLNYLDPPQEKKKKARKSRRNVAGTSFDWFERNKIAWSDLDGKSWAQIEAGECEKENLPDEVREWLAQAAKRLSPKQAIYLDAYYNQGFSLEKISDDYAVNPSSVQRGIQRGLRRMQEWIDAKRKIETCHREPDVFELAEYISGVAVITQRQRELMLIVLSGRVRTQGEVAAKLELDVSTVNRTLTRGGTTLSTLGVPQTNSIGRRPEIEDWKDANKWSIPQQLGLGLGFAYRYSGETINGMTRYQYELRRRMLAGQTAQETAEELQLSVSCVRAAYRRLGKVGTMDDCT